MPSDVHGLILVIDDDDPIREMLCLLLELEGYRAVGCRDGLEGLEAAKMLRPSLITLDMQMPGISGEEVLERLRLDASTASIPVMVISAYRMVAKLRGYHQVKYFLHKPFDNAELLRIVSGLTNGVAA